MEYIIITVATLSAFFWGACLGFMFDSLSTRRSVVRWNRAQDSVQRSYIKK